MKTAFRLELLTTVCLFGLLPAAVASAQSSVASDKAPDKATDAQLEEVVVTAQRRSQNLQRTPVAVTAISGDEVVARGVVTVNDLSKNVPGLEQKPTTGTYSSSAIFIRGIGQKSIFNTFDPGVAVYVDDVYIGRNNFAGRDIFDLDRVEVLRGPQGTLYGRNSSGGAIRLFTAVPGSKPEGQVEATYGNYERYSVQGSYNAPLTDTLSLRVSGSYRNQDEGFTKLSALGGRGNEDEAAALRASLRWTPTSKLDVRVSADWQRDHADGRYLSTLSDNVTGLVGSRAATRAYSVDELDTSPSPIPAFDRAEEWGVSGDVRYTLSDDLALRSITAYRHSRSSLQLDATNTGLAFDVSSNGHQITQELQLVGSTLSKRFNWVAGFYYFGEQTTGTVDLNLPLISLGLSRDINRIDTDAYAVYAQGTFSLTDRLRLTLGGRYSDETKTDAITAYGLGGAFVFDSAAVRAAGKPLSIEASKFTPKVGAEFDLAPRVLAYVSYTEGFKGGGFQDLPSSVAGFLPFRPEKVKATEIGLKSELLDRRLRINLSAYDNDLSDVQLDSLKATEVVQFNVATATIRGIEGEFNLKVVPGFDVFGLVAYTHSRIDSVTPEAAANGVRVGTPQSDTPRWQGQLGAAYVFSIPGAPGSFTLRGQWSYSDQVYNTISPAEPFELIPSYSLVDARVRYEPIGKRWFVQVECENCTDERFYTSRLSISPNYPAVANHQRTFGVRVGGRF